MISLSSIFPLFSIAHKTPRGAFLLGAEVRTQDTRHNITARPADGKLSCSDQVRTEKNGTALYFVIWKGNKHNYYISKEGCQRI